MAYSEGGQIDAKDFNEIFAGVPLPLADPAKQFNAIWGVGKGNIGYGQPNVFAARAPGDRINSVDWELLKRYITRVTNWQGTTPWQDWPNPNWPGDPVPATASTLPGQPVLHDQGSLQKVLDHIHKYRISCWVNGGGPVYEARNAFTWTRTLTFTVRLTWASGNIARYFFNCGGQIAMNFVYPTTAPQQAPQILKTLATDMGTVYWTCLAGTEKTNINGVRFDRVTRIGGGGNNPATLANVDYYTASLNGATGNGVLLFQQFPKTTIPGYESNTSVSIYASTVGTPGLNEDNGATVILKMVVDLGPTGISGYTMPANMGTFRVYAIQPYVPLTGWSGSTGNLLYTQSWRQPSGTTTVLAI